MNEVFVVWEGEYEEKYPVLFATRELAELYARPEAEREWERANAQALRDQRLSEGYSAVRFDSWLAALRAEGQEAWVTRRAAEAVDMLEVGQIERMK